MNDIEQPTYNAVDDFENRNSENGLTENSETTALYQQKNGATANSDEKVILPQDPDGASENSYYCMLTLLLTTASTMMSIGLAVGALNPTIVIMSSFYNETFMDRYGFPMSDGTKDLLIALTVSMLLAGGFLGALSIGFFIQHFTRKNAMTLINGINILAVGCVTIAGYLIPSYEAVIIGRFVMGFVSGAAMNLTPIITSETSTKKKSAFYLSLIGVFLSFGGLVGLMLGYKKVMGNDELWPILLSVPALPSLAYVVASPFLPETPSYLLLLGKKKEALRTLGKLRVVRDENALYQEIHAIQREQEAHGKEKVAVPLRTMLQKRGYRWQLFLVIMVFLESQFCGINGIGMYTDVIFKSAGIHPDHVTFASMVVYTVQFLVALAGSTAVDKWGPRRLSIFWSLMMTIFLGLLTISLATYKLESKMAYVSVFAVTFYVLSWACGPNITLFPLIAALTTEPTREASFQLGSGLFWIASWFVSFIPTYLLKSLGAYAFVPWAVCNLFFTVFFFFYIPETQGKTSEEIEMEVHERKRKPKRNESSMQPLQAESPS